MWINGQLVGLIALTKASNFVTIRDVEVAEDERHRHYGSIMIAFAAWYSFQCNDEGYVSLTTKTNGTEKFYQKLGAQFITRQRCFFPTSVSKKLIGDYAPRGGFQVVK